MKVYKGLLHNGEELHNGFKIDNRHLVVNTLILQCIL